jgi:hypothetical protein
LPKQAEPREGASFPARRAMELSSLIKLFLLAQALCATISPSEAFAYFYLFFLSA